MNKQLFLTNFPRTIFATSNRKLQAHIRTTKKRLLASSISGYALLFNDVLSSDYLTSIDPTKRQRSFGHIPVMWAWIAQVLEGNASCSKALGMIQSWYQSNGLSAPKGGSAGYCLARGRLKESFLRKAASRTNASLQRGIDPSNLWNGHVIKSIDGSSVLLMDTEANQLVYPQPSS